MSIERNYAVQSRVGLSAWDDYHVTQDRNDALAVYERTSKHVYAESGESCAWRVAWRVEDVLVETGS